MAGAALNRTDRYLLERKAAPTIAEAECARLKGCGSTELVQQLRMAAAAEFSADLALAQMVIGAVGLILIGATLLATRRATDAAVRAADAAVSSVELAGDVAKKQLRAYIFPALSSVTGDGWIRAPNGLFFKFKAIVELHNAGVTPALDVRLGAFFFQIEAPADGPIERDVNLQPQVSIGPANTVEITIQQTSLVPEVGQRAESMRIRVGLKAEYSDVFGDRHSLEYHWIILNARDYLDRAADPTPGSLKVEVTLLADQSVADRPVKRNLVPDRPLV
jgi:hypothetical protein